MYTTAPEEERAGLGFAVMQSLMDRVKVTSKEGKGTTVVSYTHLDVYKRQVFVRFFEQGLIYRGERIVNWCPHCLSTISDIEVEYEEKLSLIHI